MPFKAKLKIILKADETVVAESDDQILWQNTLLAINTNASNIQNDASKFTSDSSDKSKTKNNDYDPITKYATELGIEKNILIGACSPTLEKPFIHLDKHHWEAIKKNRPSRGSNAIADVVMGATILVLWKDIAKLGETLQKEVGAVLDTLGIRSKNPKRSIDNCEWLQLRNDKITINPAQTSKAINIVKAY